MSSSDRNETSSTSGSNSDSTSSSSSSSSIDSNLKSISTKNSWYNPGRRRQGLGAHRRNQLYTREVNFELYDNQSDESSSSDSGLGVMRLRREASGLDQLFALLDRSLKELWRQKLATFFELIVPLVFTAVTLILWGIWGTEHVAAKVYYDPTSDPSSRDDVDYFVFGGIYCSNTTDILPGLKSCDIYALRSNFNCTGAYQRTPFKESQLCYLTASLESFTQGATVFANSFSGYSSVIPSLDGIIFNKFVAQMAYNNMSQLALPTTTGMMDNTRYSALLSFGNLLFVGSSPYSKELYNYLLNVSLYTQYVMKDPTFYSSVGAAKASTKEDIWAIIEIRTLTLTAFDIVIHMNYAALPSFATPVLPNYEGGAQQETVELYGTSGFLSLQEALSEFYVNHVHDAQLYGRYYITHIASPSYTHVPVLAYAGKIIPLVFALSFLFSVAYQTNKIVREKELRVREAMLIMGLSEWTLYVSTFIIQLMMFIVTCSLITIMLKATFVTKSDSLSIFLMFFLYALTTIPLSGLLSTFFSKARLASLMAPVIFFILVIPNFAMKNAKGSIVTGFSVFSPSGFAAVTKILLEHESGSGFRGNSYTSHFDNPTASVLIGMLAADFGIYYILMLYLDQVIPKEYGTARGPLFFITEPVQKCRKQKVLSGGPDGCDPDGVYEQTDYSSDSVRIEGLRKEYKRGGKRFCAVDNMYWGLEDECTSVLLGHNGAGKTTLLNMVTGMVEPDEGDCVVNGLSTRLDLARVRKQLGFCPQHNILWPALTCREHLTFYAKVKGLKGWELEDAICRMLYETDLLDKMNQPAGSLSGGQKRKLSIAIAFVGGSLVAFLDEPTAGLDVAARRHAWELIKRMAESHTIMLTTHYMDEADILGKRIGIMSQGQLRCSGSGLFLKSRLGIGYQIVVSVDPEIDAGTIDDLVFRSVSDSVRLSRNGCELAYQLPYQSASEFPNLLDALDDVPDGVRGYSLSATTLEEVFLKISADPDAQLENPDLDLDIVWNFEQLTSRCSQQFRAMFIKRFWNAVRDQRMQCFQIVCPVVCILIAMLINLINYSVPKTIALDYSLVAPSSNNVTFYTAQCAAVFGDSPQLPNVSIVDTHYKSGTDVDNFLSDEWFYHPTQDRYAGLACFDEVMFKYKVGDILTEFNNTYIFLHNSSSPHQLGINTGSFYNLFIKYFKGSSYSMKVSAGRFDERTVKDALSLIFLGALIMIPLSFLPSNPVAYVVKEKECGARHLQAVNGLNYIIFWVSNYTFDLIAYFISMCLCIAIFAIFNRKDLIGSSRVGPLFVLLIAYGLTSTAMAYAASFLFKEHSTAQNVVMGLSFILGFLLLMIVYILSTDNDKVNVANKMRYGFRVIPSYSVGEGIFALLMLDAKIQAGTAKGPWELNQMGWPIIYMAIELPVFCLIVLIFDMPALWRRWQRRLYRRDRSPIIDSDEDSDVEDERMAVYEAGELKESNDVVRVVDLQKQYANGKMAVKGITFSIFSGEVFGFLGTNGAGKTTTISMLCQNFLPTGGTATLCGYDVVDESREAFASIGYCPQFDATFDLLTVEEHLNVYARIRGVSPKDRQAVIDALMELCELSLYRKTVSQKLSGGNRRKLSTALALIGGPRIIFLDEPSAGMDPVARRGLWTAIQRASTHCSVVLTTHHLEEVEALADIVSIMVGGSLKCIGDKVHLKNKYGKGFEVNLRISADSSVDDLKIFMEKTFPGSYIKEEKDCRFVFQLPLALKFGDVFEALQKYKETLGITDYSVTQTSIEQIFLEISEKAADYVY